MIDKPETQYAKTADGVHIAYQVIGSGPPDIVYANSFMSNIEVTWEYPPAVRFYERMARFCRLVLFDRRGTGLSDPMVGHYTVEDRMEDIRAVIDTVGLECPVLLGSSEGATASIVFAAHNPERVSALLLFAPFVIPIGETEIPGSWPMEFIELFLASVDAAWATGAGLEYINPSLANDAAARAWYARYFRLSASPALVRELLTYNASVDIKALLSQVQAPTLVVHRSDEVWVSPEHGRFAASMIPGARLVEIPGIDHYIWEEDSELVVEEIEEFLTGIRGGHEPERALKTLLFTDIVESTSTAREMGDGRWRRVLDRHEDIVSRQVERFNGRVVKNTGDGALATFDVPGRAITCALAIRGAVREIGLDIRAGVHTGEVELRADDVGGIAVHIAARVAASASAGEVLVSRTVADLTAGSGVTLDDKGEFALKGIDQPWRLYAVQG